MQQILDETLHQSKQKSNIITMLLAGCLYGGWAFYVNFFAGWKRALFSGMAQGILSFFIAGVLIACMAFCFAKIKPYYLKVICTAFLPLTLLLLLVALVHYFIGTPKIISTLMPSTIIGILYCVFYTAKRMTITL